MGLELAVVRQWVLGRFLDRKISGVKMRLLILFAVVAAAHATFPKMSYNIKSKWGCPGEHGEKSSNKWKCNMFLRVDSDAYVSLNKSPSKFTIVAIDGNKNLYSIFIYHGKQRKYLSYNTKLSTWAVVDEDDGYMYWEITPRGQGYAITSKYNCPSWPCNEELTSGNDDDKFLWIDGGYYHNFDIVPAE